MEVRLFRVFEISVAALNIFLNLYFIGPTTLDILRTARGPLRIGLGMLPFLLVFHLLLIPAVITIKKRNTSQSFLIANIAGILCSIAFFQIF
jgi:hypothetical protein